MLIDNVIGFARFSVDDIDPNLCTHMIYYHADIHAETYEIIIEDHNADIDNKGYEKFVGLKIKNNLLKTMISIGLDWEDATVQRKYLNLVKNAANINKFAQSAVAFLYKHKLDGINLHWLPSYTKNIGFTNLAVKLHNVFKQHKFLLSAIGSPYENEIDTGKFCG